MGKQDEALEMYGRAANLFKMAKKWGDAGNTFTTIANIHLKVQVQVAHNIHPKV